MSIDEGNNDVTYNLGYYYQYNEKNYELMKKYYLMSIDTNNVLSMTSLGDYYYDIKEYELKFNIIKDELTKINYDYVKIINNVNLNKKYYKYLKYFIELHGGSVLIESELNVGTTVTASLPIKPVDTKKNNS
jgi:TPR repeat protein